MKIKKASNSLPICIKLQPTPINLLNEFKVIVGDMANAWDRIIDLVSSPVSRYVKVVHVRNLHTTKKHEGPTLGNRGCSI
jgi:hypothetical protein